MAISRFDDSYKDELTAEEIKYRQDQEDEAKAEATKKARDLENIGQAEKSANQKAIAEVKGSRRKSRMERRIKKM